MKKALALLLFAFCFCFALNFNEQINDEAHILSQNERDELLNLVQNFEQNSTTQIAIVTLNSLESRSIEELSLEIARGYKLGQKKDNNGVLLVVAQVAEEAALVAEAVVLAEAELAAAGEICLL